MNLTILTRSYTTCVFSYHQFQFAALPTLLKDTQSCKLNPKLTQVKKYTYTTLIQKFPKYT